MILVVRDEEGKVKQRLFIDTPDESVEFYWNSDWEKAGLTGIVVREPRINHVKVYVQEHYVEVEKLEPAKES